VLVFSFGATGACLWASSHGPWWLRVAGAVAFAFVNFTPFALMHEAVHGVASPSPVRNALLGILASVMFPTSFCVQRMAHLGHHRRNRTDQDLYFSLWRGVRPAPPMGAPGNPAIFDSHAT
jgi:fatty acid desaturase